MDSKKENNNRQWLRQWNSWQSLPNLSLHAGHAGCEVPDCHLGTWCWVHGVPFAHRYKDCGDWHSHRTEDGGWCNFAIPTGAGVNLATGVTTAPSTTKIQDPHPYFPGPISEEEMKVWQSWEPVLLDHAKKMLYNPPLSSYAQQVDLDPLHIRIIPSCGPNNL